MGSVHQAERRIVDGGIVAVLRGIDAERIVPVARAIREAGVGAIEITANGPRIREKVAAVDNALSDADAVVGAGTVLDEPTAQSVIDAGAEFVLSPDVNPDVVATCDRRGVLSVPGVMTPTEAVTAIDAGADVLKMFPASTVGPGQIGALQGPLGEIPILPTGGVSLENVDAFFEAGAAAVGVGSALVNYEAVAADDMDRVRETAAAFVEAVEDASGR